MIVETISGVPLQEERRLIISSSGRYQIKPMHDKDKNLRIRDEDYVVGFIDNAGQVTVLYPSDFQGLAKSFRFENYLCDMEIKPKNITFSGNQRVKEMLLRSIDDLMLRVESSTNTI